MTGVSMLPDRPGSGLSGVWRDVRGWLFAAWLPLVLYVGSLATSIGLTRGGHRWAVALPGVVLVGSMLGLSAVGVRHRQVTSFRPVVGRSVVNVALTAAAWLWAVLEDRSDPLGNTTAVVMFVALGLSLLTVSNLLTDVRSWWAGLWWGPYLLAVSFGSFVVVLAATPAGAVLYSLLAVGVLAGAVGAELVSEDWTALRPWRVVELGPPMLAVSAGAVASGASRGDGWSAFVCALVVGAVVYVVAAVVAFRCRRGRDGTAASWNEGSAFQSRVLPALGAVMVVVALSTLVRGGATFLAASVFVVVIGVLVLSVAAEGNNLVVPLLVVVAMAWVSAPRSVEPARSTLPPRNGSFFVTFGDSYMSGEGAQLFHEGTSTKVPNTETYENECRRANSAWPVVLAESGVRQVPSHTMFLACSGAVASQMQLDAPADAAGAAAWRSRANEVLLFRDRVGAFDRSDVGEVPRSPEFALVGVGGNDVLFGTIGQSCVAPGDCSELESAYLGVLHEELPLRLRAAYHDIRLTLGPDVPVIAVPYPNPIYDGPVVRADQCRGVFLEDAERKFIARFVTELNRIVESEAALAGFNFMDTIPTALGSDHPDGPFGPDGAPRPGNIRLCDGAREPGLNFVNLHPQGGSLLSTLSPANWTHNSLHPNEVGHAAIAAAAGRWFEANPRAGWVAPKVLPKPLAPPRAPDADAVTGGWITKRIFELAQRYAFPFVTAGVGMWLLAVAVLRFGAVRGWSLRAWLRRRLRWVLVRSGLVDEPAQPTR